MRERPDPVHVRRIEPADVPACAEVFYASTDALYRRLNQPGLPRDPGSLSRLVLHFLDHDAERAWLAEAPASTGDPNPPRIVGFGAASLREQAWFLGLLFVHPDAQAGGVGRQLLLRTLPRETGGAPPGNGPGSGGRGSGTLSTCVDSIQPISTGLYAGYGIVPRVPVFSAVGRPSAGAFPALPRDVVATAAETLGPERADAALAAVDRATLGYARPVDHAYWREEGRSAVLLRRAGSGDVLGYGYAQASGRLGPVALLDETLTAAFLGFLVEFRRPPGPHLVLVPGSNDRAMVALLHAGLRFEGFPGLLASTRPMHGLERYLAASFALL